MRICVPYPAETGPGSRFSCVRDNQYVYKENLFLMDDFFFPFHFRLAQAHSQYIGTMRCNCNCTIVS